MSAPRGHIEAIDGLRSIAVLSIVLFHINAAWIPGGFVGVDIFFVISGFVVAYSVKSAAGRGFFDYFFWFYRRRIIRIYPALLVCVLVTILIVVLFLPRGAANNGIISTGAWSLIGFGNVKLYRLLGSYFEAVAEYNPFTHMWSLGVEEQYYIVFPIFSYFMLIAAERSRIKAAFFEWIVVALFVLSLAACVYFSYVNQAFAFYMIFTRFWELLVGYFIAYAVISDPRTSVFRGLKALPLGGIANIGAILLLAITFVMADEHAFPFPWALAPCLAALILILSAYRDDLSGGIGFLRHPVALWIGRISYSLYLWHWVVIVVMRWFVGIDTLPTQLLAAVLMLGLACVSYYGVENPVRNWTGFRSMRQFTFYASFTVLLFGTVAGVLGSVSLQPVLSQSRTWHDANWGLWEPGDYSGPDGQLAAIADGGCAVRASKGAAIGGSQSDIFTPLDCPDKRPQQLFMVGDSHSGSYKRIAYSIASRERMRVVVYSQPECRPLSLSSKPLTPACRGFLDAVLRDTKPGDVLFLPGLNGERYRNYWDAPVLETPRLDLDVEPQALASAVETGLARLKPFMDKGGRVILELPKPMLTMATLRCADWYSSGSSYCQTAPAARDDQLARRQPTVALFSAIAERSDAISLWDPFALLCTEPVCESYRDGQPLYVDTDHLSPYGNDVLFPSFRSAVRFALGAK